MSDSRSGGERRRLADPASSVSICPDGADVMADAGEAKSCGYRADTPGVISFSSVKMEPTVPTSICPMPRTRATSESTTLARDRGKCPLACGVTTRRRGIRYWRLASGCVRSSAGRVWLIEADAALQILEARIITHRVEERVDFDPLQNAFLFLVSPLKPE
jgi:hypothetical protein